MIDTKRCSKCHIEKSVEMYFKSNTVKSGYQGYCKECHLELNKLNFDRIKKIGPLVHPESKICNICKTRKPISQFGKKSGTIDGKIQYCKPCWIVYVKKAKQRKLARDRKS